MALAVIMTVPVHSGRKSEHPGSLQPKAKTRAVTACVAALWKSKACRVASEGAVKAGGGGGWANPRRLRTEAQALRSKKHVVPSRAA